MKTAVLIATLALAALVSGCASPPQPPVAVSEALMSSKTTKVGVAMAPLPKVDTEFPGAGCLLCLATASLANQSLTAHVQTLPHEDLPALKGALAKLLATKGLDARVIDEPLLLKDLPSSGATQPNVAQRDHTALKAKYKVDKLLVIDITAMGAWRNYASYIPTGDPQAVFKGTGYIVDLANNALDWYQPVDIRRSADQKWDEPPKFPGLTNAYFQALEDGKDAFTQPFRR